MTLYMQTSTMLAMIGAGIYLGFAYTTFRLTVSTWLSSTLLSYLMAIVFGLSQALVIIYLLYLLNDGEVRFFVFLSIVLGYAIYQLVLHDLYEKLCIKLGKWIGYLWKHLLRILHMICWRPLIWLCRPLWRYFAKVGHSMRKRGKQRYMNRRRKVQKYIVAIHRSLFKNTPK